VWGLGMRACARTVVGAGSLSRPHQGVLTWVVLSEMFFLPSGQDCWSATRQTWSARRGLLWRPRPSLVAS
jgi:hypothetical protein